MKKISKEQRRQRRKAKKVRQQQRREATRGERLAPWAAPKMKLFTLPQVLKDDVPFEKRLELLRALGKDARSKFDTLYPQVEKWVTEYDPIYVLSVCAFYLMAQKEGVDREATGALEFPHHYLELLQAFALCQPRNFTVKPLLDGVSALKEHMSEMGRYMSMRHFDIPERFTSEREISAYRLRTDMMLQTAAVRNWAYPHQMRKVLFDLSKAVEPGFKAAYGVDPTGFFSMLMLVSQEVEDRLNTHIEKLRSCTAARDHRAILKAYNDAFPENVPISEEYFDEIWAKAGKKRIGLLSMLMTHADLKIESIYSFTLDRAHELIGADTDKAALHALLEKVSLRFAALAGTNREHFILSNPVLERPFISLDNGTYFSAVWGVLPHMLQDILEDLVWTSAPLRDQYTKAKAAYLEDELERIVRAGFPNGQVFKGSTWHDDAGVLYENDLVVVIDTFAIVFEAKSASVSDPARRGAPDRLAETLRELIEAPSEQALRFIERLRSRPAVQEFKTKRGVTNTIDSRPVKHYIPMGVTLSHLGLIASNLKKLIAAGIVEKKLEELAPSISITDLESVFELLEREVEKVHYLARRREFEAHMEYEGDELDLLGFYLDNGFNIGDTEYAQDLAMSMVMKSKELDPYFVGSREGKLVSKPRLAMTKWWAEILNRIGDRKFEGWLETGFILLNTTKEDQEKFEAAFGKLAKQVMSGTANKDHNWIVWESGPKRRRYIIVGYPYLSEDKELRNSILAKAIAEDSTADARGVAAIGVKISNPNYPYDVLVRRTATDLFDTLTLEPKVHEVTDGQ